MKSVSNICFNICKENWNKIYYGKDSENRIISLSQRILNTVYFFPLLFVGLAGSVCWLGEHALSRIAKKTNDVGITTLSVSKRQSDTIKSKPLIPFSSENRQFYTSNFTLPSFSEICNFISYDENQLEIPSQLVKNVNELMILLDSETRKSYDDVNKTVQSLSSEEALKAGENYFVHVTLNPISIFKNGIKNEAVSMSLFDIDPKKPGLYLGGRDHGVGLIYEVPPENIVAANRNDLFSPTENQTQYIIHQYQCQVIKKYISRLWHQSKFYEGKPKKPILPRVSHSSIRRIDELIEKYEKNITSMNEDEKKIEFKNLFNREGTGILGELLHIQKFINSNKFKLFSNNNSGSFQNSKKLTSLVKSDTDFNEVFVLTPSTSKALGLNCPKIKGVLLFDGVDPKDSEEYIKKEAQKLNIPVYSIPDPFFRSNDW